MNKIKQKTYKPGSLAKATSFTDTLASVIFFHTLLAQVWSYFVSKCLDRKEHHPSRLNVFALTATL